jgi:hypothetical protein
MRFLVPFAVIVLSALLSHLTWAQSLSSRTEIEAALRLQRPSAITATAEQLQVEFSERRALIQKGLADLIALEQQLIAKKAAVEGTGRNALSFMQEYAALSDQLPEEVKKLIESKPGFHVDQDLPAELKANPQVQAVAEFVNKGLQVSSSFIQDLDRYTQDSLDLGMLIGLQAAREEIASFSRTNPKTGTETSSQLARLQASSEAMEASIRDYLANKHQYGQANDNFRTTPYSKFYSVIASIFRQVSPNSSGPVTPQKKAKISLLQRLSRLTTTLKMSWFGANLASAVVFDSKPDAEGVSRITTNINSIGRLIGRQKGQEINVIGKENLPVILPDGKDIYILTPSHRHGLQDVIGIAHLGLDNFAILAKPKSFIPAQIKVAGRTFDITPIKDFLISKLAKNMGFIVTGGGHSAVEKMRLIISKTAMRFFLIYPEGKLPDANGSSGVMRENKVVKLLEEMGFRVSMVPITMVDNFFPLGVEPTHQNKFEVKVFPTISHELRKSLTAFGGHQALSNLFRYGLVDELRSNQDLLWGQVRASRLPEVFEEYKSKIMKGTAKSPISEIKGPICREALTL